MEKYKDMRHIYYNSSGNSQSIQQTLDSKYNSEATIRLPFSIGKYPAFVMHNNELSLLISSIYQANLRLERLGRDLPGDAIKQFWENTMVEEVQQTNEVENVHSTRKEIREAVQEKENAYSNKRFWGMVKKYDMLIAGKEIPLRSCTDIRKLYDEFILDEVMRENPENAPDGLIFRKGKTGVYSQHDIKIHEGLYPEQRIIEAMEQALAFLNDPSIDPLIQISVFHYAFAYIHPFYDGNGRMTRFISSYKLSELFDKSACLRISYFIKANRPTYYRMFKEANDRHSMGEITGFVMQFLTLFKQAIDDSYQSLSEKKSHYERYKKLLEKAKALHPVATLLKTDILLDCMLQTELFGHPSFSIELITKLLECSPKTARKTMDECEPLVYHKVEKRKFWWHINLDYLEQFSQET
jgi:Fic family protein